MNVKHALEIKELLEMMYRHGMNCDMYVSKINAFCSQSHYNS